MEREQPHRAGTHIPVLMNEAMEWLALRPDGTYVDATVGAGGHSRAILERLTTGHLIGIDKDPSAIALARENLQGFGQKLTLLRRDFTELPAALREMRRSGVDGILADIGFSQMQIDSAERGFSFQAEGPLDMRMDPGQKLTAEEIVNRFDERELADLIYEFGEERRSQRIARAIVRSRPIRNTVQLATLISACLGGRRGNFRGSSRSRKGARWVGNRTIQAARIHPATRTFQALRIAVNHELDHLTEFLRSVPDCLHSGGRVVIISFHSLEDRIVKQQFREWEGNGSMKTLTRHIVRATPEEVRANRRSRSARLRAAERTTYHADNPPSPVD